MAPRLHRNELRRRIDLHGHGLDLDDEALGLAERAAYPHNAVERVEGRKTKRNLHRTGRH
jgi:hypothetical protein